FGHFELDSQGQRFHVPAIMTVKKLAENDRFLAQVSRDAAAILGTSNFSVIPFGVPLGGVPGLSVALVNGDGSRLRSHVESAGEVCEAALLLCDFLSPHHSLEEAVAKLRSRGVARMGAIGIGQYANAPKLPGVECRTYLPTNYVATQADDKHCGFCKQSVPVITGFDFTQFEREIKSFDPYTFWSLVGEDPKFFSVGHWASDITPNHFYFRVLTAPLFRRHAYGLAIRIRNVLRAESGVLPNWIGKIVCADGPESRNLSIALTGVLG